MSAASPALATSPAENVEAHIADAVKKGAKVVTYGKRAARLYSRPSV
jgi:acyl-CoA reductase-like NAD-dependent aldehyde dehydrogenase